MTTTTRKTSPRSRSAGPPRPPAGGRSAPGRGANAVARPPPKRKKPTHRKKPVPGGPLTREDKAFLRGLGHHLDPVIQVGLKGVTETLVAETKRALKAHELIKVKLGKNAPEETLAAAQSMAEKTKAEVIQVIGGMVLLYLEPLDPLDRKIQIPGR